MKYYFIIPLLLINCVCYTRVIADKPVWPAEVFEVFYLSDADQTRQPAMVYAPSNQKNKRPLLVALHTWSSNYKTPAGMTYAEWCMQNDWYMIYPNFRGPNNTPEAMGSEYVVKDIVSAVDYMKEKYAIDANRIYLTGGSGGGYASLLMAGRTPGIWAAVSAWCPITDVQQWWHEKSIDSTKNVKYAKMIEMALGGKPVSGSKEAEECIKRSPVTCLHRAKNVKLDINHGVWDGRRGSVPFTHSLKAFNIVCEEKDRLSEKHMNQFYQNAGKPDDLISDSLGDPLYGKKEPVFRRISNNVRITIFDGGHNHIKEAGLNWLAKQRKNSPVVWKIENPKSLKTEKKNAAINQ